MAHPVQRREDAQRPTDGAGVPAGSTNGVPAGSTKSIRQVVIWVVVIWEVREGRFAPGSGRPPQLSRVTLTVTPSDDEVPPE
jgi:hypothetical protein